MTHPNAIGLAASPGILPPDLVGRLTAQIEGPPPIPGWCRTSKAIRMAEIVVGTCARLSVELGVFGGRGTLALATGHAYLGHGYAVGIDPWKTDACYDPDNDETNNEWWKDRDLELVYRDCVLMLMGSKTIPHWQLLRCTSAEACPRFAKQSIDILHQDSNHSEAVSCAEVRSWAPAMRPGGIWIADDAKWASLQKSQRLLVEEYGYTLVEEYEDWRVYQGPGGNT